MKKVANLWAFIRVYRKQTTNACIVRFYFELAIWFGSWWMRLGNKQLLTFLQQITFNTIYFYGMRCIIRLSRFCSICFHWFISFVWTRDVVLLSIFLSFLFFLCLFLQHVSFWFTIILMSTRKEVHVYFISHIHPCGHSVCPAHTHSQHMKLR